MTEQEIRGLLAVISEVYPSFPKGRNFRVLLQVWHSVMKDLRSADAEAALMQYIREDAKGFPPPPGALRRMAEDIGLQKKILSCILADEALCLPAPSDPDLPDPPAA